MCALRYPAVSRNRVPILSILKSHIDDFLRPSNIDQSINVLEIASGSGEHAAFFASEIPNLIFQPTEPDASLAKSIACWATDLPSSHSTVLPPLSVGAEDLKDTSLLPSCMQPPSMVDLVLCINMIHISPFSSTHCLFETSGLLLRPGGLVFLYGPFREEGQDVMCESNEAFDASLRQRDSSWGIRDLREVRSVAEGHDLELINTVHMPANNLCVIFKRR